MQKILVTGYPHCGTTILRKIIGNHSLILDIPLEMRTIDNGQIRRAKALGKIGVVIKEPFLLRLGKNMRQIREKYKDYKIVMIMRNPVDIVSSMNMRFNNDIPSNHSFEQWQRYAHIYLDPISDFAFKIKYEEMFDNDYQKLKELFVWLGLEWSDDVINTNEDRKTNHNRGVLPKDDEQPPRNHSDNFRTWQINQKVEPMINKNLDKLDEQNKEKIMVCDFVKQLGYNIL
jgi:hypothetical protein